MKRVLDMAVAAAALLIAWPAWSIIVLAVRLDSRGKAFFNQEATTKDGGIFGCTSSAACGPVTVPSTGRAVLQAGVRASSDSRRGAPEALQPR
jgi:hypothetical protein